MAAMHHNNRRRERCEKCSYSTDRVSDLRKHLERRHGVREEKTSGGDRRWRNERPWRGQHQQEEHWTHRRTDKKNEDVPAPSTVEPIIDTPQPVNRQEEMCTVPEEETSAPAVQYPDNNDDILEIHPSPAPSQLILPDELAPQPSKIKAPKEGTSSTSINVLMDLLQSLEETPNDPVVNPEPASIRTPVTIEPRPQVQLPVEFVGGPNNDGEPLSPASPMQAWINQINSINFLQPVDDLGERKLEELMEPVVGQDPTPEKEISESEAVKSPVVSKEQPDQKIAV